MIDTANLEPRRPTAAATAVLTGWIAILSLPMWAGKFLAGPYSDQSVSGYAFRHWAAEQWRSAGRLPQWNPEIFGGLPFVGAMHGDIFYPTAWLRLILPTDLAMNLGFAVHYVLAGLFMYLLLRALRLSWTAALVGGFAYQLSGVIGSYVAPGHDGKLFVTALLPLMLLALLRAMRDGRIAGYFVLALAVGLGMVSPQHQMLYYALVATGIFALYLTFGREDRPTPNQGALQLATAVGAIVLGAGIGMIQVLPFLQYLPFSPRAETFGGYQDAVSYAIPWVHVPEFLFAHFAGTTHQATYWGPNTIKLHSEYLGLPVVALAAVGALSSARRRIVLWLGGIGLLFLLVALGGGTPFYRVWYEVMPFMKQVRAPGMALFIVALVVAIFASFGVERIQRGGEGLARVSTWFLTAGLLAALIALSGMLGAVGRTFAEGIQLETGRSVAQVALRAQGAIRIGGFLGGVALAFAGAIVWLHHRGRIPVLAFSLGLLVIVSGDLFRNVGPFWIYGETPDELFAPDAVTELLRDTPMPYRVLDTGGVYPGSALMAFAIPQLLGHHGVELHRFDELLGGQNRWDYIGSPALWDLFALRYVLLRTGAGADLPQWFQDRYSAIMSDVATSSGVQADLFVRRDRLPYARLVPAAAKAPDEQAIEAIVRGRLDFDRLVLLGEEADVTPPALTELPPPIPSQVSVTAWAPGSMALSIQPAAPAEGWVVVSENWYPAWKATVDGEPRETVRGNVSLITVPVPAGTREVVLSYESRAYAAGKAISLLSLAVVAVGLVLPGFLRRRASG